MTVSAPSVVEAANTASEPSSQANAKLKARQRAGQEAIRRLQHPIRGKLVVAQLLAVLSDALAVAPYVALVAIGNELFEAESTHRSLNTDRIDTSILWLVTAFCVVLSARWRCSETDIWRRVLASGSCAPRAEAAVLGNGLHGRQQ
ncbi:hypothetical protein WG915_11375, partial [Corynebacterium sp. H128]